MKNTDNKEELLLQLLAQNITSLSKVKKVLQYSMKKCTLNMIQGDEGLESCEALTARFSRATDILTQKMLKNIFLLLKEDPLTFIDKSNTAEKIGIIKNSSLLLKMRDMRNKISHEYSLDDISEIFADVAKLSEDLCKIIDEVIHYAKNLEKNSAIYRSKSPI